MVDKNRRNLQHVIAEYKNFKLFQLVDIIRYPSELVCTEVQLNHVHPRACICTVKQTLMMCNQLSMTVDYTVYGCRFAKHSRYCQQLNVYDMKKALTLEKLVIFYK